MAKKLACPYCGSFNLKQWALGKNKCGSCQNVFPKVRAVLTEYIPKTKRPPRKIADIHEMIAAKKVGGRKTTSSGSTPCTKEKGDVVASDLRMECKTTEKKSYVLKIEDLMKLSGQARGDELPVFSVEFRGDTKQRFYILDEGWFLQLLEAYRSDSNDR
jgi:hypothetical protein